MIIYNFYFCSFFSLQKHLKASRINLKEIKYIDSTVISGIYYVMQFLWLCHTTICLRFFLTTYNLYVLLYKKYILKLKLIRRFCSILSENKLTNIFLFAMWIGNRLILTKSLSPYIVCEFRVHAAFWPCEVQSMNWCFNWVFKMSFHHSIKPVASVCWKPW